MEIVERLYPVWDIAFDESNLTFFGDQLPEKRNPHWKSSPFARWGDPEARPSIHWEGGLGKLHVLPCQGFVFLS